MILKELNALPCSAKDLRKFAFTMSGFFALWCGLVFWKHGQVLPPVAFAGLFFLCFGAVRPEALRLIYRIWMGLALCMGWVMTRVILTVLFYGVLTPLAVFLRLKGRDLLDRKLEPEKDSYWQSRGQAPEKTRYTKQF